MPLLKLPKVLLILTGLVLLTLFLETWRLGNYELNEFDEGRFAVNAFEMMHNGDYINLHYMGNPDTWVARPPLKSWFIMGGYKTAGFNVWGARLSSVLATTAFVVYCFFLSRLFFGPLRSAFICLILLSCKGIIGFHVGRSADMDAELILFLTAFTYHFSSWYFFEKKNHAALWGYFLALAFLLKTTASLLFAPGVFLFILSERKLPLVLKDRSFWLGAGIYLFTVFSWFVIVHIWGARYENTQYAGNNAWQTMLIYDTWMRFTANHFDGHPVEPNYLFFIHVLDSRFNIWNYFAYAGILWFVTEKWRSRNSSTNPECRFILFSLFVTLPPALLLTFGMHKLDWYIAPVLYFLAVLATEAEERISGILPLFRYAFICLLLFCLVRHFLYIDKESKNQSIISFAEENKDFLINQRIGVMPDLPSNLYAWLCWNGYPVTIIKPGSKTSEKDMVIAGYGEKQNILPANPDNTRAAIYDPYGTVVYFTKKGIKK